MGHRYLHSLYPFREVYPHTSCPDFLVINFPIMFLPSPCHLPNHWPQLVNHFMITCLVIFPSEQSEQPGVLPEVLLTWSISLHHCPSGISQKEAVVMQLSTLRGSPYIIQSVSIKQAWGFILYQLIIGNTQETIGADRGIKSRVIRKGIMDIWVILHVTYLRLHGLLSPYHVYAISIWWWNVAVYTQLYDLVNQITPSSWRTAQVAW